MKKIQYFGIIKRPIITEKSTALSRGEDKGYLFEVAFAAVSLAIVWGATLERNDGQAHEVEISRPLTECRSRPSSAPVQALPGRARSRAGASPPRRTP